MLTPQQLNEAADTSAAFRRRRALQPAGARSDKVFPPLPVPARIPLPHCPQHRCNRLARWRRSAPPSSVVPFSNGGAPN